MSQQDMRTATSFSFPEADRVRQALAEADRDHLREAVEAAISDTREVLKAISRERLVNPDFFRRVFTI